jgi:hypothetical protein
MTCLHELDGADKVLVGAALVMVAAGVAVALFAPIETLGYWTNDDTYYYLQPALNVVQSRGVTFDGMNPTNGFHPLWMLVVVGLAAITGADHELLLRATYVILTLLLGGSVILCWFSTKRLAGVIGAVMAMLCFFHPSVSHQLLNGLESGLLVFIVFLLLWANHRYALICPEASIARKLVFGLLLAMVFLCRLDTAFVLIGIAVAVCMFHSLITGSPRSVYGLLKAYWPVYVVFLLVVAPYFIWNFRTNGHLSPLSGALKSSFPHPSGDLGRALKLQWLPYSAFIVLSVTWVMRSLLRNRGKARALFANGTEPCAEWTLCAGVWLGLVMHFVYCLAFTTWGVMYWTFASYVPLGLIAVALVCGGVVDRFRRRRAVAISAAALILGICAASQGFMSYEKGDVHAVWHDAAEWVRENTPEDAVFGMTDCGYFGYFSRRSTVNLDGLINGYEYQEALAERRLGQYFEECGIDYIVDYEVEDDGRSTHKIKLDYPPGPDRYVLLSLPMSDWVYASHPYHQSRITKSDEPAIRFIIWKYDPNQVRR